MSVGLRYSAVLMNEKLWGFSAGRNVRKIMRGQGKEGLGERKRGIIAR